MEYSTILGIYLAIAVAVSAICVSIFKEGDYHTHMVSRGLSDMSYTAYIYERICHNLVNTFKKVEDMVETMARNIYNNLVKVAYPTIAKNIIYKDYPV
jgi:hypothetical protein